MTEQHECEWRLTVGHSNCKACHYSAIEGVAVCEICNESLGPTEIERRLNEYETLKKASEALSILLAIGVTLTQNLDEIKLICASITDEELEDMKKIHADILEGK